MTMNNELIRELAHRYFADRMPEDLRAYLFDRYTDEPLEGDLAPQFFFPAVLSDIQKYIRGELDTTLRTELQKLLERYDELSDITSRFAEDIRHLEVENRYYVDFINWMQLGDKYHEFQKTAHEEHDEMGFSYYTM